MTEQEWLDGKHPPAMLLVHLQIDGFAKGEQGKRKQQLFACACCRRAWHLLPEGVCQETVRLAESVADGLAQVGELKAIGERIRLGDLLPEHPRTPGVVAAVEAIRSLARGAVGEVVTGMCDALALAQTRRKGGAYLAAKKREMEEQVLFLRDIFGNPYRPAPSVLTWNDGLIRKMAQSVYEERLLPEGFFDRTRLLGLADALEKAGCTNPDILLHCRRGKDHVRGCWLIDLILNND